jgi:DNA-binding response OmpR family regulator
MGKKILIIDDEADFVTTLKMRLEALGYAVIAAYDGKSGLETAKKTDPDLILLDLVMTKMTGFEVLAELKRDPYTAATPVIMLTAKSEAEYTSDAKSLGAADYLVKPVKIQELEAAIRKFL